MKIAVFGSGHVGQTLGLGFAELGHDVMMGSRNPDKDEVKAWRAKAGPRSSAGSYAEAAGFSEMAALATSWEGTENALRLAGPDNLAGKVVVDVTNPLLYHPDAKPTLALGCTDSGGEQVQRWLAKARVVKAFNSTGYANFIKPVYRNGTPDMFICGNDGEAKKTVTGILRSLGWGTVDLGRIEASRLLEPLCLIWVYYGIDTGTWTHAFKLLTR